MTRKMTQTESNIVMRPEIYLVGSLSEDEKRDSNLIIVLIVLMVVLVLLVLMLFRATLMIKQILNAKIQFCKLELTDKIQEEKDCESGSNQFILRTPRQTLFSNLNVHQFKPISLLRFNPNSAVCNKVP